MNKRDVPGRLINEPEQLDLFFSLKFRFSLTWRSSVVWLCYCCTLLRSHEQNQYCWVLLSSEACLSCSPVCGEGKDTEGNEWLQTIPSSALCCRCIFSVLEVMSWYPKLLPETHWLIEALGKSFIPKYLFSIHIHKMKLLWLTQTLAVRCKNSHPFVREWHHRGHLFPDCIKSVLEAGADLFVPLLFPRFIKW